MRLFLFFALLFYKFNNLTFALYDTIPSASSSSNSLLLSSLPPYDEISKQQQRQQQQQHNLIGEPISTVDADYPKTGLVFQFRRDVKRDNGGDIETRRRSAIDKNFMRFGRAGSKNMMRFGRGGGDHLMRFGRSDKNLMRFGRADKNLMRFGRADKNMMRFGRSDKNLMRFGRSDKNLMRFGRSDKNLMRFGRSDKNLMRFGRSDKNLMRFGRSDSDNKNKVFRFDSSTADVEENGSAENYERIIRNPNNPQNNRMRFGKRDKNLMRFGRNHMMRFGRSSADNRMRFGRSESDNGKYDDSYDENSLEDSTEDDDTSQNIMVLRNLERPTIENYNDNEEDNYTWNAPFNHTDEILLSEQTDQESLQPVKHIFDETVKRQPVLVKDNDENDTTDLYGETY